MPWIVKLAEGDHDCSESLIIIELNSEDDREVLPFNSACTESPKKEVGLKLF